MPTLQKQKSPVAAAKSKKKTATKSKPAAKGGKKGTKSDVEIEINLTCTHCNKTFTTEAGLLYHMGKKVLFVLIWCRCIVGYVMMLQIY